MATQARMPSYAFGESTTSNYSTPSVLAFSQSTISPLHE